MRWLIDGYNVIRRDPELAGLDQRNLADGREGLLRLLARVARDSGDEFVVVFDGARGAHSPVPAARVRVVFSRPPEKADDVLVRLARAEGDGATVVTSDRTVQDASRRAHAAAVGADEFLAHALAGGAPPDGNDADDAPRRPKTGNPRRPKRAERRARRALDRLRRPRP